MRCLLLSFFVLILMSGFSQKEEPSSDSKAEDIRKEKAIETKDKSKADSITTLKYDRDARGAEQKSKKASGGIYKEVMDVPAGNSAVNVESEATGSEQQYRSAVQNFEYSKKQSSVQRMQRSPSVSQQKDMEEAVDYFEEKSPNSFEYHYFKYVAGNYDVALIQDLKQAEKLRSNNADVHVQMAAYYMIKDDQSHANSYIEKLIASKRLSDNALKYAEDILLSVPQNGTLITHGFDDTYASWYLQSNKKVRTDVKLVSLDFLQSEFYRDDLAKSGFNMPSYTKVDVNYFTEFCKLNASKNISISLTTPKEYFTKILPNVYVVGLVFSYHKSSFDNFKSNEKLWNYTLKKHLVNSAQDEKGKQLSSNYLPMLLQMRKVYHQKGDDKKVAEIDKVVDKISAQCKKYEQVQKLKKAY